MRRSADFVFALFIAWLVSFCSMGYELLIARFLASLSNDAVFAQSLTVGCFLLALGIGAFVYGKRQVRSRWTFLANIEILLSLLATIALPYMALSSLSMMKPWKLVVSSQIVTFAIGFLSGAELPALIDLAKAYSARAFGWVLAANYVGALAISILLPQYLVPILGLYGLSWILSLLTALAAGLCFIRSFEFKPSLRWPGLALVLFLPPLFTSHRDAFEQFYLKSYYYVGTTSWTPEEVRRTIEAHRELPRVIRLSSGYQEIDLVQDDLHLFGLSKYEGEFHLLLDQKNQFGSHTEAVYHDTMVHAGLNLAKKKPEHALVIGGGDGMVVRDLLKYPEVKSITLVELDPQMIHLANEFPPLRELNKGSFHDPRVTVVIADGFEWLRNGKDKFDGIFIDLPHPNSIDLSRLYSVEFYTFAKRRLNDDGFLVFDFPFSSLLRSPSPRNNDVVACLVDTIQAAGFPSIAGFGFWESFMIASPRERTFEFDYEALDPYVSDLAAFNMALIDFPKKHARINSIFRPVVLKTTFEGG